MALKSTIFKATLTIADTDRHYYAEHTLTLARHPSETDERMMVRLTAFVLNADDALEFGKGLSADDEPDLWRRDLTGSVEQWIEVGLPDERRLRRASGRARQVLVIAYGGRAADVWWSQNAAAIDRLAAARVIALPPAVTQALASMAERTMQLHATVQDGELWLSDAAERSVHVVPVVWKG